MRTKPNGIASSIIVEYSHYLKKYGLHSHLRFKIVIYFFDNFSVYSFKYYSTLLYYFLIILNIIIMIIIILILVRYTTHYTSLPDVCIRIDEDLLRKAFMRVARRIYVFGFSGDMGTVDVAQLFSRGVHALGYG